MSKRETPIGDRLAEVLDRASINGLATWDDACRAVAGAQRTNWKTAEKWLRERRDDETLGWLSIRVEGTGHYLKSAEGAQAPGNVGGIYVHPGKLFGGWPRLTTDWAEAHNSDAERQRQGPDRLYWVRADVLAALVDQVAEEKRRKTQEAEAGRAQYAHLAAPLRALLAEAGIETNRVHVTPPSKAYGSVSISLTYLDQAEIESLNVLLAKAGYAGETEG